VGVLIGTVLQTVILFVILSRTKWQKEVQYTLSHLLDFFVCVLLFLYSGTIFMLLFSFFFFLLLFPCSGTFCAGYASRREDTGVGRKCRAATDSRNGAK
jgi:hypothetical protein